MAIFRVVRPARSESPTSSSSMSTTSSSSSSSDDSSDVKQHRKLKRIVVKPAQRFELCDKNTEICQVGEIACRLPRELFHVEELSNILSLDTWNNCLTEKEREKLCTFLPDMEEELYQKTLIEILGGGNINFGNPSVALLHQLKAGMCSPKANKHQEVSRHLQRIQHYHGIRQYHNDMVNSFAEMQCAWSDYSDADIDERMELWHAQKSTRSSGRVSRQFESNAHGERPFKERVSSMSLKNKDVAGGKHTEASAEARRKVPSQKGNVGNHLYPESMERVKQNSSKRNFVLVKHSSSVKSMAENDSKVKTNGKKKLDKMNKGGENASTVPGMKISTNNGPIMGANKQDVAAKHSLNNRLEQGGSQKRHNDRSFKSNQVLKGSKREKFSDLRDAKGGLSTSEDSDFMAEFMQSEEEPSSRKRLKQGKEEPQDDSYSGASSAYMRDGTPYRVTDMSASPPSPTPNFSFSVLHFLSAVRASLLGSSQLCPQSVPPVVPFHEVVSRVQTNPGDFRVLSIQEPLDGLVRGVLKVFSSKTTRPPIQGWKPLVVHDRAARGWCWAGPVSAVRFTSDMNLAETDAEAWGISQKMLFKIVDAFAIWFNGAQELLLLFAQLGVPPLPRRPFVLNENERFQGLRAQRSLITINSTSNEMRAYFRQEEAIRYSLQDTVFFYITACGEKSAVAPLRRLGRKPNSKARDHLVLRSDRPSHVTILYLVRDAAARLPRSYGTRADVAVLLRDSQYIVDDASDTQLSQVVSGALDRLRYERDPCVQFDAELKLWVYLHSDREEEDFEDDGTSSTKRWKRGKKDATDSFDMSGQDHASTEEPLDRHSSEHEYNSSPGSFAGSDLNYGADTPELFYNHHGTSLGSSFPGQMRDDSVLPLIDLPSSIQSSCTNMQSHPMGWEMYR